MQQPTPLTITTPALPPRLIAIGADGQPCAPGAHVAVLLPDFGLLFDAGQPASADNWTHAKALAAECRLLGHADWRLPEVAELALLIDYGRSRPAIDAEHFPKTPTSDWYWSATAYAPSPSDVAWSVPFGSGGVNHGVQRYSGFVRPVRRVSSGQCLGLLA